MLTAALEARVDSCFGTSKAQRASIDTRLFQWRSWPVLDPPSTRVRRDPSIGFDRNPALMARSRKKDQPCVLIETQAGG